MKPADKELGLTVECLRKVLDYDSASGNFTWCARVDDHSRAEVGEIAGHLDITGYWRIWIGPNRYLAHRLVWLWMTGSWPKEQVDHIDGDRANNRWNNLRAASASQNKANGRLYRKRLNLPKGVFPSGKKFGAQIKAAGELRYLGVYETPEAAHLAYADAAQQLHGEFANRGV